jgi:hypothetical protein
MTPRASAARALVLASVSVATASVAWAWATFSYWEAAPIAGTVSATAVLAALSVYVRWHKWRAAVGVGAFAALANLIAVLAVTLMRWEG